MKSFLGKHVSVVSSLTINIDITFCKKKNWEVFGGGGERCYLHIPCDKKNPPKICSGAEWKELQPVGGKAKKVLQILISHNDDGVTFFFGRKCKFASSFSVSFDLIFL